MFRLLSKKSMESLEMDQKDRMFNRSRDYYRWEHVRPEGVTDGVRSQAEKIDGGKTGVLS